MRKRTTSNRSQTDWDLLSAMEDQEIDLSEMFAKAVVPRGLRPEPRKAQLTLRIDNDVIQGFESQGRGYQARINTLLRAYMEAHVEHQRQNRS